MAFKKGEDKNRFSSPLPVGDDIKAARKLTLADFERVGHKIWFMGFHEIVKAMNSTSFLPFAFFFLFDSKFTPSIKLPDLASNKSRHRGLLNKQSLSFFWTNV